MQRAPPGRPRRATDVKEIMELAQSRLRDYQGESYAGLYTARMNPFLGGDARLAAEVGRPLAPWMSYEDIIRVADLKTRASRFERVRREVGARQIGRASCRERV